MLKLFAMTMCVEIDNFKVYCFENSLKTTSELKVVTFLSNIFGNTLII